MKIKIEKCPEGSLILSCGNKGMESDLVFCSGAMDNRDPLMADQRAILEYIVAAVDAYKPS